MTLARFARAAPGGVVRALTTAVPAGAAAAVIGRALRRRPPGGGTLWARTNHRGEEVTLLEGPAFAAAAAAGALLAPGLPRRVRIAGAVAAAGAGAFGAVDDLAESGTSKGLRGHLGALARGEVTTGGLKIAGIGLTGIVAAALAADRPGARSREGRSEGGPARAARLLADGALVAGAANVVNLLDLRPGRALKVVLLHAPLGVGAGAGASLVAAACGPAAALLPDDLRGRWMLGDTGANAAGALLGAAAVAGLRPRTRSAVLAGLVGLTLASERVSFTRVIEATPGLRELDALGRAPIVDRR